MHNTLIEQINRDHGSSYRLRDRYADGEQGAFALADAEGAAFVLKVAQRDALGRLRESAANAERMRALGYPAPRYVVVGATADVAYSIQTAMPGQPLRRLSAPLLPELLALNALQAGQAPAGPRDWPAPLVALALEGGPGYCLLEPMRAHSAESAALLDRVQAIARRAAGLDLPRGDLVHFDFTPLNILVDGERISGVIDWDSSRDGDRAFDLATLLFYTHHDPAVGDALAAAALALVGPAALALYLAHLAHRQVDWTIRHYDEAAASYMLAVAQKQLGRYAT